MKKYLIFAGLFVAGVFLSDTIKPMLASLPVIGGMFDDDDDDSKKDGE